MALISNLKTPDDQSFGIRAGAIPFATVDSTSTSTAFTATVPGITELVDGTTVMLKNGVVTSATNFTININGLGAKPCYTNLAAATRDTTIFNINYTMIFVYDSTRVSGGGWICYRGYDANTNTIGYQVRTNSFSLPMDSIVYRYRLLFQSADNTKWVPATNSTSTNATAARTVCQGKINPFGSIVYYGTTASVAAGSRPSAAYLWQQYAFTLGYSFQKSPNYVLTAWKPVYLKCAPQTDGSAIIDADVPFVQALPSTEDGKIYILLGYAYSETAMELVYYHPVYHYKGGMIRLYTTAQTGGAVNSVNGQTGTVVLDAEDVGALPDDTVIPTKTSDLTNDLVYDLGTITPNENGFFAVTDAQHDAIASMWGEDICAVVFNAGGDHYYAIKQDAMIVNNAWFMAFVGTWGGIGANDLPTAGTVAIGISISKIEGSYWGLYMSREEIDQYGAAAVVLAYGNTGQTPIVDGTATIGISDYWARADHVHPTDTSRLGTANGNMTLQLQSAKFRATYEDESSSNEMNAGSTKAELFSENFDTGALADVFTNANGIVAFSASDGTNVNNMSLSGTQTQIHNVVTPSANGDAANKQYVDTQVATRQATLVSGANIKTVGGTSVLGSGDIALPTKTSDLTNDSGFVTSDTKVTQTVTTTTDYTYWRGLCVGSSSSQAETGSLSTTTDQVRIFSNIRVQPSTGTLKATVFKGQLSGTIASSTTATTQASTDNSTKVATTAFVKSVLPAGLPSVSSSDNGKVLMVVNGAWAAASLPVYNGGVI